MIYGDYGVARVISANFLPARQLPPRNLRSKDGRIRNILLDHNRVNENRSFLLVVVVVSSINFVQSCVERADRWGRKGVKAAERENEEQEIRFEIGS